MDKRYEELYEAIKELLADLVETACRACRMVSEVLADAGSIEISDFLESLQRHKVDERPIDDYFRDLPDGEQIHTLLRATDHGYSAHVCEHVYTCPNCGRLVGGWYGRNATVNGHDITNCLSCDIWLKVGPW